MTSWLDYYNVRQPAPPPPPESQPAQQTAAPGAWWAQGTGWMPTGQVTTGQQPQPYQPPPVHDYRPQTAESVNNDTCPRCGSGEYAAVVVDTTFGGANALLSKTGGMMKRCFDCRYPQFNSSGDIIKGKGVSASNTDAQSLSVRQAGNAKQGSWSAKVWDQAPLIA